MVCGLAYSWTMKTSRRGSMFATVSTKDACCRRYCSTSSNYTAVIIVVLHQFVEDPLIVSDLVYLDVAPRDEDGRSWEEVKLEIVQRAVWGML